MELKNFAHLGERLQGRGTRTAVVAAAEDVTTLKTVVRLKREGLVSSILVGDEAEITDALRGLGEDPAAYTILTAPVPEQAARVAVRQVSDGQADFLVKGKLETSVLLREVVNPDAGLRTGRLMTHLAFLEIPHYHKLIVLTDSGMVIAPDLDQKRQILENAVSFLRDLGYDRPKVGVLAAVERVSEKMPGTVDAHTLQQQAREGEIEGCLVEGPLSYDLVMDKTSARKKGYESEVVGNADVMLCDNMTTGNVLGKCLVISAGASMAGLVVGAKVPIALSSRGAGEREKYQSILLAAASCAPVGEAL